MDSHHSPTLTHHATHRGTQCFGRSKTENIIAIFCVSCIIIGTYSFTFSWKLHAPSDWVWSSQPYFQVWYNFEETKSLLHNSTATPKGSQITEWTTTQQNVIKYLRFCCKNLKYKTVFFRAKCAYINIILSCPVLYLLGHTC